MERRAAVAQEDLGGGSFDESKAANYSIPRCELARYVQVPAPTLYGGGRGAAVTYLITRGEATRSAVRSSCWGGVILRRGGRRGAWALPVAPGLYRAVPAGTRLARITSRSGSGSLAGPVVSGHRGNSARDTLISARRASGRRVSRGVQRLNVSSSSASMPICNPMDGP